MNTMMPAYVVQNFGLNGSGTVQQFVLFERYVKDQLSPGDTVVITFCGNDYYNNTYGRLRAVDRGGQIVVEEPTPFGSKLKDALKEHSRLFNLLAYTTDLIKLQRKQRESAARAVAQTQDQPAPLLAEYSLEVRVMKHFLTRFHEECQRNQARVLVVDIGRDLNMPPITRAVGCELIALQAVFDEAQESGRVTEWQIPKDGHWNAQGHRLAAEAISAHILEADR